MLNVRKLPEGSRLGLRFLNKTNGGAGETTTLKNIETVTA